MDTEVKKVKTTLLRLGSKESAKLSQRFFKTGKGEYGEGDLFLGVRVPVVRRTIVDSCIRLRDVPVNTAISSLDILLKDTYHECRLAGLLILVYLSKWYEKKERVSDIHALSLYYLKRTKYINNWDLVDTSASDVLGRSVYLSGDTKILVRLSKSKILWERRIAVIAAWYFTKHKDTKTHMGIIKLLENDTHDLMHKACGWMLREIGKVDRSVLTAYLDVKASSVPRTMLRYAIERLSTTEKKRYMKMK